jgi:hypothetical protein
MQKTILATLAASALLWLPAAALANHGDCVMNTMSGKTFNVPETAGNDQDFYRSGTQIAEENGAPFEGMLAPCGDDPPFPAVDEIPLGTDNPNAQGAPYGPGGNAPN